jgi:hypothetical protein
MTRVRGEKCFRPHTRVTVFLAPYGHLSNGRYASQISFNFTARFVRNYHLHKL